MTSKQIRNRFVSLAKPMSCLQDGAGFQCFVVKCLLTLGCQYIWPQWTKLTAFYENSSILSSGTVGISKVERVRSVPGLIFHIDQVSCEDGRFQPFEQSPFLVGSIRQCSNQSINQQITDNICKYFSNPDIGGVQMTKLQSSLLNEDPSHIFRMELPLCLLSE